MPATWKKANDDVLATAQRLISQIHPDLSDVRIVFMFRSEPALSGGKIAYAKTQKVAAQMRLLLEDADFIIWVSYPDWMSKQQAWRDALIDHQLTHCGVDDDGDETKYYIRPHDIEEFHTVIARHGSYTIDIQRTDTAIEQAKANQLTFAFQNMEDALNKATQTRGAAYTVEVKSFTSSTQSRKRAGVDA